MNSLMAKISRKKQKDGSFYEFLFQLSEEITNDDLQLMKFLSMGDAIPQSELEDIQDGKELFEALIRHDLLKSDDLSYLHSVLFEIQRMDLCTRIQEYSGRTKKILTGRHDLSEKLSSVRKMLLQTALGLDSSEVKKFSFALNVPRYLRETITSGIDLFGWLLKQKPVDSEDELLAALEEWGLMGVFERTIPFSPTYGCICCGFNSYPPISVYVDGPNCEELEYVFVCSGKFGDYHITAQQNDGMTMTKKLFKEDCKSYFATNKKYGFLKHPIIFPVYSVVETSPRCTIIYSAEIAGTLDQICAKLDWKKRTRVLFQITSALNFLHKPVPSYRGILVHHDVAAENIFLDSAQNALLSSDTFTEIPPADPQSDRSKDIFDLGIVTLQMLKWPPVEQFVNKRNGCDAKPELLHLFNGYNSASLLQLLQMKDMLDANVWCLSETGCKAAAECLVVSARDCLVTKSDGYLAVYEQKLKDRLSESEESLMNGASMQNCTYCRLPINETDPRFEVIRGSDCMSTCPNSYFCSDCIRNGFRNPLNCIDHGPVFTPFNHPKSVALLFSGSYDYPDEQQAVEVDVAHVRRVITNPRIMGFRSENVHDVQQMSELTGIFSKTGKSLQCLFVYYSGHTPARGSDASGSKYTNILDLKRWLKDNRITFTRSIFIVDCCSAASNVKPISDHSAKPCITMFACADDNESTCASPEHGSTFTRYLLTGLRGDRKCPCSSGKSCRHLINFYNESSKGGFVTADVLIQYVRSHFETQQPVLKNVSLNQFDGLLAFCNEAPVFYNFSCVRPGLPSKSLEIDRHCLDLSVPFDGVVQCLRKYLGEDGILSANDRSIVSFQLRTLSQVPITDLKSLSTVLENDETVEIFFDSDRLR